MGLQRGATALQARLDDAPGASALRAETGLVAPDSYARAPSPLATHDKQGSNQPRTLIMAG